MLPEVVRWGALIVDAARKHKLAPSLLAGLLTVESGGNPDAVSRSGAVGLGQVMPREYIAGRPTAEQLHDPATNLEWACRILAEGRDRWGTQAGALAAYYGAVDDRGHPSSATDGSGVDGWGYVGRVEACALEYLALDQWADADLRQYAPTSGSWREVALVLKGICDDVLPVGRALANTLSCLATQATAGASRWGTR